MKIYDFVEWELQKFRDECNFTDQELTYFNLRAKNKSNVQIAYEMNVSESTVSILARKVKPSLLLNESELLTKELSDIFPQYGKYVESKKEYQLNDAPKETVIKNMKLLCKEVGEFISMLYCNSDMPEERSIIQNTINSLKIKNGG